MTPEAWFNTAASPIRPASPLTLRQRTRDARRAGAGPRAGEKDRAFLVALACLVLGFVGLLASKRLIFGSLAGNWAYPYVRDLTLTAFTPFLVTAPLVALLLRLTSRRIDRHPRASLAAWLGVGLLLQMAIRSLSPFGLGELVRSDHANSFYSVAQLYPVGAFLSHFETIAPTLPAHAQHNMPGKVVLFQLLGRLTTSPERLGLLVILISTLGGLLVYSIARMLFASRRVALYALVFYLILPARIVFLPLLNAVAPLPPLVALWSLCRYLSSLNAAWLPLVGVSAYVTLLFDPLTAAAAPLAALPVARCVAAGKIHRKELLKIALHPAASFLILYLAMIALYNFELFSTLRMVTSQAADFNPAAGRPYGIWVAQNLKEFFINCGLPQTLLLAAALGVVPVSGDRRAGSGDPASRRDQRDGFIAAAAVVLLVVAIDLTGVNRGEVSRLWIFLAVFVQIPAARACAARLGDSSAVWVALATILQASLTASMIGFVQPR